MPVDDFLRAALASYFVLVGVVYSAKIMGHRARTGEKLQWYGRFGAAQWIGRMTFEAFRWAILALCVVNVFWPEIGLYLGRLPGMESSGLRLAGLGLMMAGLAIVSYAHNYLGLDWRTGVPTAGPVGFVETGPYRLLRHPIFVGVHLAQIGFFLAWPTIFSLVCLGVGATVIQIQARVEEGRMERAFGEAYRAYRRRTPGWLPGLRLG